MTKTYAPFFNRKDRTLYHTNSTATTRLSPTEWRIFEILYENKDKPITTGTIFDKIWGNVRPCPSSNIVPAYVCEIRKKLPGTGWCIRSKFGRGYNFYTLELDV